jgi:hypothetical protein
MYFKPFIFKYSEKTALLNDMVLPVGDVGLLAATGSGAADGSSSHMWV